MHVKNHYVPELYLKRWGNAKNEIWVYNLLVAHQNVPHWRQLPISGVGYQKHLYTQLVAELESDHLENWLNYELESPTNEVIEKVISERKLTKKDWHTLISFLAAQDVRTPAKFNEYIQWAQKEYPKMLQKTLDDVVDTLKNSPQNIPKELETQRIDSFPLKLIKTFDENKLETLQLHSYVGRSSWLRSIKHMLGQTQEVLHHHKWSIIKPAEGLQWFTSDNPVIKLNYKSDAEYDLQGGWNRKSGNIIFPLGPKHAMFVEIGKRPPLKFGYLNVEKTIFIQRLICENAHRKIFHYQKDDAILKYRKRIIDKDELIREKARLEKWHEDNSNIEMEYSLKSETKTHK